MKIEHCTHCGDGINANDKFCQNCGSPATADNIQKSINTNDLRKRSKSGSILSLVVIAMAIGLLLGWIRYWIGYYILIQGVLAGLIIPWLVLKTSNVDKELLAQFRFQMALLLFLTYMAAQAIGFGLAQPVFDPFSWSLRVWSGQSSESVFGIFSTGGVVHQTFSQGLSGGFWALLYFIDLFFMFFFLWITLPLPSKKNSTP